MGTTVPIVLGDDAFYGEIVSITDIPNSPEFRSMLRIYGVPEGSRGEATVRIFEVGAAEETDDALGDRLLADFQVALSPAPLDPSHTPGLAQIPLWTRPELQAVERVRVEIRGSPDLGLWAMVSATNNDTQHVTILSPPQIASGLRQRYHPRMIRLLLLVSLVLPILGCNAEKAVTKPGAAAAPLNPIMLRLQAHAAKLWFAGQAGNWDLVRFYLDKVDENADEVMKGGFTHGTTDVSATMETVIPPVTAALREAAFQKDHAAFAQQYDRLVAGCNSCHRSAGLAFLEIRRPTAPPIDSQSFEP